jgi:hypothetical protein
LSLPEEYVDVAKHLEAPAIGLSGGPDHPSDVFDVEGLAV